MLWQVTSVCIKLYRSIFAPGTVTISSYGNNRDSKTNGNSFNSDVHCNSTVSIIGIGFLQIHGSWSCCKYDCSTALCSPLALVLQSKTIQVCISIWQNHAKPVELLNWTNYPPLSQRVSNCRRIPVGEPGRTYNTSPSGPQYFSRPQGLEAPPVATCRALPPHLASPKAGLVVQSHLAAGAEQIPGTSKPHIHGENG